MSVMWQIFRYVLIFGFIYSVQKTIFNLIEMYENPKCGETADFQDKLCLESILNNKPNLDLFVYVSDKSTKGKYDLILERKKFDYLSDFEKDIDIELPRKTRNNGSLFIYTVFALSRPRIHDQVPLDVLLQEQDCVHTQNKLTKYMVPVENAFNLLNSNKAETGKVPITHLRSKYTIDMCTDHLDIPHRKLPEELYSYIRLSSENKMLPIFFQNVMHSRLKDLVPIKPDDKVVTLKFIYHPQSLGMMRFNAQLKVTLLRFLEMGFTEKELDEVKGVFVDTNLYLLCATICIGSIHLLLDVLTFKNDISFWRSHSSMAGLSTRTVLWRAFSQTVIFLFLLDEGTSLLILVPSGISTLIEFWKVNKVLKPFQKSWFGGKAKKIEVTKEEEETKKYDDECMRYLSYVLYPLLIGAAVYSLMFQPHKSWYSWTINSLVNGVYAFGFLFMLPQLFINYRLKSVAALPWRAFTYKAFNTFIDDIFAFIITMPTAHRVACFRDDVVFIIYLYQRWLYPVDTTRKDVDPEVLATSSKTEIKEKTKED